MIYFENIVSPSSDRVRNLAHFAASMDEKTIAAKIAIVAPNDFTYGLARMYETFRHLNERSKREVRVFRSMQDALAWLGKKSVKTQLEGWNGKM